jgi:ribosome-associated translation inhibitor RaiA
MHLRVSSPGTELKDGDIDRITRDLEKIDRRLHRYDEVYAQVRINGGDAGSVTHHVTLEIEYGRNHLIAKSESTDVGQAVRVARDEIIRQINDRSRRTHSEYSRRR